MLNIFHCHKQHAFFSLTFHLLYFLDTPVIWQKKKYQNRPSHQAGPSDGKPLLSTLLGKYFGCFFFCYSLPVTYWSCLFTPIFKLIGHTTIVQNNWTFYRFNANVHNFFIYAIFFKNYIGKSLVVFFSHITMLLLINRLIVFCPLHSLCIST